jgi:hypothetical protein
VELLRSVSGQMASLVFSAVHDVHVPQRYRTNTESLLSQWNDELRAASGGDRACVGELASGQLARCRPATCCGPRRPNRATTACGKEPTHHGSDGIGHGAVLEFHRSLRDVVENVPRFALRAGLCDRAACHRRARTMVCHTAGNGFSWR